MQLKVHLRPPPAKVQTHGPLRNVNFIFCSFAEAIGCAVSPDSFRVKLQTDGRVQISWINHRSSNNLRLDSMPPRGGRGGAGAGRARPPAGKVRIGGIDIEYDEDTQQHVNERPQPADTFPVSSPLYALNAATLTPRSHTNPRNRAH